jgi:hypothetical protein
MQELHATGGSEISQSQVLDPVGVHYCRFRAHNLIMLAFTLCVPGKADAHFSAPHPSRPDEEPLAALETCNYEHPK